MSTHRPWVLVLRFFSEEFEVELAEEELAAEMQAWTTSSCGLLLSGRELLSEKMFRVFKQLAKNRPLHGVEEVFFLGFVEVWSQTGDLLAWYSIGFRMES